MKILELTIHLIRSSFFDLIVSLFHECKDDHFCMLLNHYLICSSFSFFVGK